MPYVNDQGTQLWFDVAGQGEPLVGTGGWGLLHEQFHAIRPLLTPHLKFIDWNYRGCGHSDRSWAGNVSVDRWVDDLVIVLDHLKLEKIHLWGTSTGSNLAIRFASRYPSRLKSLITFPSFRYSASSRQKAQTYLGLAENFGYQALAKFTQWIGCGEKYIYGAKGDEIAKFETDAFARNFTIASLSKIMEAFYHCDLAPDVKKLTMPVLLLMGTSGQNGSDHPNIKSSVDDFKKLCPRAEVATLEGAGGTYCMVEEPEATAPLVLDWVKRHA